MRNEKARSATIHRLFLFIDIIMMVLIPCTVGFIHHEQQIAQDTVVRDRIGFVIELMIPILEVLFSLTLTISACYIASWIKESTGKKQNNCLPIWHIINLFLLITVLTCLCVFYFKKKTTDHSLDAYWRYYFYNWAAILAKLNTEFYVDLFLLWLLYRFMKPQNILQDGRTEASALLFAHDGKKA